MTEYTPEIRQKLANYLEGRQIPQGIGTEESACSIAAINLAMSGRLTDEIPECMSGVIGKAIIGLQDAMPDQMRNSARYKKWLITAPGTGTNHERERLEIMLNWLWGTVLPELQPFADKSGFGGEWACMTEQKTPASADAAYVAASNAAGGDAANAAANAARAADGAANGATAYAAGAAANAAACAAAGFWGAIDPIGVLERMTLLNGGE